MKNRIEYIDALRGFAILLVVLGHLLQRNGYNNSGLYNTIYSFHMPLFFCISGFVTEYSCKLTNSSKIKDYLNYIKRKFNVIMIPYLFWSLVVDPLFFTSSFSIENYKLIITETLIDNVSYWFLPCLFFLLLLYVIWKYISTKINSKNVFLDLSVFVFCSSLYLVMFFLSNYDFFRSALSYVAYFAIGVIASKYNVVYNILKDNSTVFAFSVILFSLIVGYFSNSNSTLSNKIIRLSTGILSLPIWFHIFSDSLINQTLKRHLSFIGKYTLIIYVLHNNFTFLFSSTIDIGIIIHIFVFGIISVFICIICIFIGKIIEKNTILSFVMLGKLTKVEATDCTELHKRI